MLKLQRLQQKSILDDDYDAGELQTFRLLLFVFNPFGWSRHSVLGKSFSPGWNQALIEQCIVLFKKKH